MFEQILTDLQHQIINIGHNLHYCPLHEPRISAITRSHRRGESMTYPQCGVPIATTFRSSASRILELITLQLSMLPFHAIVCAYLAVLSRVLMIDVTSTLLYVPSTSRKDTKNSCVVYFFLLVYLDYLGLRPCNNVFVRCRPYSPPIRIAVVECLFRY